jgi:hypothetical protein
MAELDPVGIGFRKIAMNEDQRTPLTTLANVLDLIMRRATLKPAENCAS